MKSKLRDQFSKQLEEIHSNLQYIRVIQNSRNLADQMDDLLELNQLVASDLALIGFDPQASLAIEGQIIAI